MPLICLWVRKGNEESLKKERQMTSNWFPRLFFLSKHIIMDMHCVQVMRYNMKNSNIKMHLQVHISTYLMTSDIWYLKYDDLTNLHKSTYIVFDILYDQLIDNWNTTNLRIKDITMMWQVLHCLDCVLSLLCEWKKIHDVKTFISRFW